MDPAAEALRGALGEVTFATPRFPVISNVLALPNADPTRMADLLVRQVASPVRWQQPSNG